MQVRMQKTLFGFCVSKETREESDDGLSRVRRMTPLVTETPNLLLKPLKKYLREK